METYSEMKKRVNKWGRNKTGYTNHLIEQWEQFINHCQCPKEKQKALNAYKAKFGQAPR